MKTLVFPLPADGLLPHCPPMLLLDEVTDYREGRVSANVAIRPNHLFADGNGDLDAVMLIEILAQAAAALRGCRAKVEEDSEQRIGFLAGLKKMRINAGVRVGDHLSAEARQTAAIGQAVVMEGSITRGGDCLAAGTLNVWEELADGIGDVPTAAESLGRSARLALTQASRSEDTSLICRAIGAAAREWKLKPDANEAIGEFCFDEHFAGFRGHFPRFPILPGIVMLEIVLLVSGRVTGHRMELAEVERAKFAGQVRPGQSISVRVHLTALERRWRIAGSIVNPESDALILKLDGTARQMDPLRADEDSIRP